MEGSRLRKPCLAAGDEQDWQARFLAPPDRPSLAVLPFATANPDDEYLVEGICDDIITALYKMRWLFVIARNTTFAFKGRAVDVTQIAR
jgi:TolB-like protein